MAGTHGAQQPEAGERTSVEGCTVVVAVWGSYAHLAAVLADRLEPFFARIESDGGVARMLVVDNASRRSVPLSGRAELIELRSRLSPGLAKNVALARVVTDVVCFLDADDFPLADGLHELYRSLRAAPVEVAALCGAMDLEGPRGGRWLGPWPHPAARRLVGRRRLFAAINALVNETPISPGTMIRTEIAVEAGGFGDLWFGEDWVLAASLAGCGQIRFHREAKGVEYVAGGLSRITGRRAALAGFESVRLELLAGRPVGRLSRFALRTLGPRLNAIRASRHGSATAHLS